MCRQLEKLATSAPSSEEVERAKRACETNVLAALEMSTVVSEDIARQILSYGERINVEQFQKEVQVCPCKPLSATVSPIFLICAATVDCWHLRVCYSQ